MGKLYKLVLIFGLPFVTCERSYPLSGETVDVVSCASHYNGNCCINSYDIQVKNCGEYYVFNLKHTQEDKVSASHIIPSYSKQGTEVKCAEVETSDNGGLTPGCEFDPCHPINYKVINGEIKRSSNYTLKNCGSYRTYYLQQLNVDKSAYCFGTLPVPETTTIKSTTISTTEKPDKGKHDYITYSEYISNVNEKRC
ncbi:unnamed protein product [Mytilus coruscus]|uniref:Uncharacterized protein n=1 Tax=Mytilus coruscus TaxID=42192 RepID=A0A6J8CXJ4_MYTCO|nr:unnamed protein product [Mytilus coruscus]